MGEYYFGLSNALARDELQGGGDGFATELWNINVGANAVIERGMLLCASLPTAQFSQVTSAADVNKVFAIASTDYIGGTSAGVTQAYTSGKFNRERIKLGGAPTLTLETFENELRKQNIILTGIQDKY